MVRVTGPDCGAEIEDSAEHAAAQTTVRLAMPQITSFETNWY